MENGTTQGKIYIPKGKYTYPLENRAKIGTFGVVFRTVTRSSKFYNIKELITDEKLVIILYN